MVRSNNVGSSWCKISSDLAETAELFCLRHLLSYISEWMLTIRIRISRYDSKDEISLSNGVCQNLWSIDELVVGTANPTINLWSDSQRFPEHRTSFTDDPVGVEKATWLFHDALAEMERTGCQEYNMKNLAETLKSQGNRAMQSKLYLDSIELYNCAIALCENNAVYYCNRAAAYTQAHRYAEAVGDCLKSIEIDPNYSKAYSRLGTAYFAQGNYADAIDKGFKKALQLDPSNEVVKENIRMAEQKMKEDQQRAEHDQSVSSSGQRNSDHHNQSACGSSSHAATLPPFGSMPFNATGLPADFANMFMNMATNRTKKDNIFKTGKEKMATPMDSMIPGYKLAGTSI